MGVFSFGTFAKLYFVLMVIITPANTDGGKDIMKQWGKMCVEEFGGKPVYGLNPLLLDDKAGKYKVGVVYCEQVI